MPGPACICTQSNTVDRIGFQTTDTQEVETSYATCFCSLQVRVTQHSAEHIHAQWSPLYYYGYCFFFILILETATMTMWPAFHLQQPLRTTMSVESGGMER